MIPQFCKACGGRLEEMDREFCKANECQTFARRDVMGVTMSGDVMGVAMSKDTLLALLRSDIDCQTVRQRADALRLLRDEVRKYPWDDVSKFNRSRLTMLEAFQAFSSQWAGDDPVVQISSMMERRRFAQVGGDASAKLLFKKDLTRLALSKSVQGVELEIHRIDQEPRKGEVHLTIFATATSPIDGYSLTSPSVVLVPNEGADLFSVPRSRVRSDYEDIEAAIAEDRLRKRHVHLAQGHQLDGCALRFGLERKQNTWDPSSQVTIPMEPDVSLRDRIIKAMPLERGDQIPGCRDLGLSGVSINRMTGAASGNYSRGRVAGKFDSSSGKHLDIVAEMNGIKRKGGETDENLRGRLYQATEE